MRDSLVVEVLSSFGVLLEPRGKGWYVTRHDMDNGAWIVSERAALRTAISLCQPQCKAPIMTIRKIEKRDA